MKPGLAWERERTSRSLILIPLAVLAVSLASVLSLPGSGAWAAYQSPVSPLSPSLSLPPEPPSVSPTAAAGAAPTPAAGPSPAPGSQTAGSGDSTASLAAGGIILAGLIVGAVVFLMRGQPPNEPQEKE